MDANEVLAQFTIPTPCPMDWDRMAGDDRVRFCEGCGKHVYNLTAMRPDERASLTSKALTGDDELCGRLDHRPDGKLFVSEGQPALQVGAGAGQFTIRWLMAVIAACATVLGMTKLWFLSPGGTVRTTPPLSKPLILMGKMVPRRFASPTTGAPSCPPTASPAPGVGG